MSCVNVRRRRRPRRRSIRRQRSPVCRTRLREFVVRICIRTFPRCVNRSGMSNLARGCRHEGCVACVVAGPKIHTDQENKGCFFVSGMCGGSMTLSTQCDSWASVPTTGLAQPVSWGSYDSRLLNSVSGPEIGLPGRSLVRFCPAMRQNKTIRRARPCRT